jgi:hypothetical protein
MSSPPRRSSKRLIATRGMCPNCKSMRVSQRQDEGETILWFTCRRCWHIWCVSAPASAAFQQADTVRDEAQNRRPDGSQPQLRDRRRSTTRGQRDGARMKHSPRASDAMERTSALRADYSRQQIAFIDVEFTTALTFLARAATERQTGTLDRAVATAHQAQTAYDEATTHLAAAELSQAELERLEGRRREVAHQLAQFALPSEPEDRPAATESEDPTTE